MRRFLAVSLLSMTLALSGLSAVRADETVGSAPQPDSTATTSTEKVATTENGSEESAINKRAALRGKHLHQKHTKVKVANKVKTNGSESKDKSASGDSTSSVADNGNSKTDKAGSDKTTSDTATNTTSDSASVAGSTSATTEKSVAAAKRPGRHLKRLAAKPAAAAGGASTAAPAAKKSNVGLGERLASTMVGTIVGTPVNMVRKSASEAVIATKDLVGDTNNKFLLGLGGILGVPGGMVSGVLEAPFVAGYHAWKVSGDEPFSANSVGLGDN